MATSTQHPRGFAAWTRRLAMYTRDQRDRSHQYSESAQEPSMKQLNNSRTEKRCPVFRRPLVNLYTPPTYTDTMVIVSLFSCNSLSPPN